MKQPAWEEFLAVCRVLKRYEALRDAGDEGEATSSDGVGGGAAVGEVEPKPTAFGRLVGAINAENELWVALVLTR